MNPVRWALMLTIVLGSAISISTLMPVTPVEMPSGSDKLFHFVAFLALAFPLAVVRPRWSGWLFMAFSAFGGAIELIQPFVGRSRELADLFADMAGVACGMALGLLVGRVFPGLSGPASQGDEN